MNYLYTLRHVSIVSLILLSAMIFVKLSMGLAALESQNYPESIDNYPQDAMIGSTDKFYIRIQDFVASLRVDRQNNIQLGSAEISAMSSFLPSKNFQILDELQQYAQACDQEIGVTVPDFSCDAGTLVPTTNLTPAGNCDRPNQLNKECDPGSRFQMLTNNQNAYIAAHCRKKGLGVGRYGDIAVIQYNRNNGATCFYQALGDLDGNVQAPSKGTRNFWMTPTGIRDSSFPCASCHDNGPFIRSPYLTQITGANALPGSGDSGFNKEQPYYFVGSAFADWKAYKVEVANNLCNTCHRMGVSNLPFDTGTSLDFGIRATSSYMENPHKNPDSASSPFWMLPGQTAYSSANAAAAHAIRECALRWRENPLPNLDACKITLFTGRACNGISDIYVDSTYTGAEQGTATHPYRTLSAAYQNSCNGTQIHIKAGSYPEALTMTKNVILLSEGGVVTIGENP